VRVKIQAQTRYSLGDQLLRLSTQRAVVNLIHPPNIRVAEITATFRDKEAVMSEMREMTEKELDAVCGGGLSDSFNIVVQPQIATQIGVAVGGFSVFGNGGNAAVQQWLSQVNLSHI
jgi:hypothetical protein